MFVMEAAIQKAAQAIGVKKRIIQEKNLLKEGDEFSFGQIADRVEAGKAWQKSLSEFDIEKLEEEVAAFNKANAHFKKGIALMPICFGISFTNTPMNHARALVHIYQDGSVGISTGGVEMGQGLNTKMVQVVMHEFSIAAERIKIESTNTTRVANTSPSAASATADLNGKALELACRALVERLKGAAAKYLAANETKLHLKDGWVYLENEKTELDWETLIKSANLERVNLTENGHYATPVIHFDKAKEKGHPFAYHVYGNSITTVTGS